MRTGSLMAGRSLALVEFVASRARDAGELAERLAPGGSAGLDGSGQSARDVGGIGGRASVGGTWGALWRGGVAAAHGGGAGVALVLAATG